MSEAIQLGEAPTQSVTPPKDDNGKILGKFADTEELQKAYVELEKKLGGSGKETSTTPPAPAASKTPEAPAPASKADLQVEAPADPFQRYSEEFTKNGKLSDESYKVLEKEHRLSRQYIDTFLQGQAALGQTRVANERQAAVEIVGSEETLARHLEWAKTNFNDAERAAYNQAVNSGNIEIVKQAVAGLKHRFESANGREPTLVGGRSASASDGSVFRSWAEVTRAMADRRYKNDPAYQKDILDKLSRSSLT